VSHSTPPSVDIIVRAPTAGVYTNQALVTGEDDPNPANNVAGATITVAPPPGPPAPSCTVIGLAKTPLTVAKAALTALHCGIGKIKKAASKTIQKGLVVGTSPKAGTVAAAGTPVTITVSSGRPKSKRHKGH
jgi:hypothetical protein